MNSLTGTLGLTRLILRRDRVLLPAWILWLAVVPAAFASTFAELYPTAADRAEFATSARANAALVGLFGPVHGSSVGALTAWRLSILTTIVGLISALTVIRHTRAEEEAGRRELLAATSVGSRAALAAPIVVSFGASLAVGVLGAVGLATQDLPAGGAWAFGLQVALAGGIFAAVGAVASQLATTAGAARGLALGALGASFLLRLVADLSDRAGAGWGWVAWGSPLGWVLRLRPFVDGQGWVSLLAAGLIAALLVIADHLASRRDLGEGVLHARLGPERADPSLGSPVGLAWRLHRGLLAGWLAGFAAIGTVLGAVAHSSDDLLESESMQDVVGRLGGPGRLSDAFLAAVMSLLGLLAAGYAIQAMLRLHREETTLRAEAVLATPVARLRWAASHVVFAALGPALALTSAGFAGGVAHGLNEGDLGREVPRVVAGALLQLPAVWMLTALAVAFAGLAPRFVGGVWAVLAGIGFIGLVGGALQFDQLILDASPFTHVPDVPGGPVGVAPLLWLLAVTATLAAAGLTGLRHRDIPFR